MIAHPSHRQVGQNIARRFQPVGFHAAARGGDERAMGLTDALGLAGGAGGVEHHRHIIALALLDFGVEKIGVVAVVNPSHFHQGVNVVDKGLVVMAHPARVVVDDVLQLRGLLADFQQLIDLLLILDRRETDGGVVQHEQHFRRHRVLIQRHRHAAQALRGAHHHVEMRAVVADDGEVVAALEAQRRQAARQRAHPFGDAGPAPGLPNAEILLADGGGGPARSGVVEQQARKGLQPLRTSGSRL